MRLRARVSARMRERCLFARSASLRALCCSSFSASSERTPVRITSVRFTFCVRSNDHFLSIAYRAGYLSCILYVAQWHAYQQILRRRRRSLCVFRRLGKKIVRRIMRRKRLLLLRCTLWPNGFTFGRIGCVPAGHVSGHPTCEYGCRDSTAQ